MSGYRLLTRIKDIEKTVADLGMRLGYARGGEYIKEFGDVVAVLPGENDCLPVYSRDAEIFVGTLDQLESWLAGVQWARKYDFMMFGPRHHENRKRKEQDYRNQYLLKKIANPGKEPENEMQSL